MIDERKELILKTILKEHIKTGLPVGSSVLAEKYDLGVSPATIRNDMAELEEEGYIKQPYTSAGRIPTEKAFRFCINNLNEKKINDDEFLILEKLLESGDELALKQAAKLIAKLSNNAVFWAFHRHNLYYTGISNFLSQPEFAQNNLIYDISAIIDRMDEIIDKTFDNIEFGDQILLGSNNPFSKYCSSVVAKYKSKDTIGMVGILGPMRMNYEKNLALIRYINKKMSAG